VSDRPKAITVFTHARVADTRGALMRVLDLAREAGVELYLPSAEAEKHELEPREGVVIEDDLEGKADVAIVLGGDGTILSTLRRYGGTRVPVFAVNFGAIGFLATVEPWELEEGVRHALGGEFDVMELPQLVASTGNGADAAINDISFHRRQDGRVAELAYSVAGEELGEVRCDGLVAATPAGSTGYNLANGGPVLAWGVEGFVVSFIAPHTLTARSLVVAPGDVLEVRNRSREEEVDMTTDGQMVAPLPAGGTVAIRFEKGRALLAQAPGATFYHRLRDKFGRLSY
jgi:NAD+ kinase